MRYEEVTATEAFDMSPHGHAFMNPYNGCSMGCPFCYWLSQSDWEGRIQIKTNFPGLLERAMKSWPKDELLYLGSVCDPFNELERTYGLTRRCLELVRDSGIPLLITTSAVNDILIQEAALLKEMKQRVIVVVELARIPEIERMRCGGVHTGIRHANQLYDMGLEVWATLAPICPGIIELEPILEQLNRQIPVYIDSLQCTADTIQGERMMAWIRRSYPALEEAYDRIVKGEDTGYYKDVLEKYGDNSRIKTFPFQL